MPTPKPKQIIKADAPKGMSFGEAIDKILNGKRVTRIEWNDKEEYGYLDGEDLSIHHKGDDTHHIWRVRIVDMSAKDYIEI